MLWSWFTRLILSLVRFGTLWLLGFLNPGSVDAAPVFDFNPACKEAYNEIIALKLDRGKAMLEQEKKRNPDNLIPVFLENYIDFFTLFYNEDPLEYSRRIPFLEHRLNRISQGSSRSPWYLFSKSVIHFQWAAVKVKFGNTWDAGWEFRRSFLQIKENRERFPDFYPNDFYYGAMEMAVGTIPEGYRWLSNLFGIRGSIQGGMKRLESFLDRRDDISMLYHGEAVFYYCYLRFYLKNERSEVFKFIESENLDLRNNHLFAYLAANLSLNNQASLRSAEIIANRNLSAEYLQTPVWDFEMGYARLHHLESDAATYLEKFLRDFRGKFYVKDALQKLSWYYYLRDDSLQALSYRKEILIRGSTDTEADKQALQEARQKTWPNKILLRARLLHDGGYFQEAFRLLHGKQYSDFTLPADQVEFNYRAGRLFDDAGNEPEAIRFYELAIRLGRNRPEYFAARAALQIGMIYEKRGDMPTAIDWYRQCMAMKDHDYKNALDQRARAGISRCRGD